MKTSILAASAGLFSLSSAFALPTDIKTLLTRDALPVAQPDIAYALEPRAGGGGGRGGGGGGGSSGGSRGSSSSSSSSGSSGSSGASGASRGTTPSYGRAGSTYAGGASAPYTAGGRSPRGINPVPIAGIGLIGLGAGYYAASYPYGGYQYELDDAVTYQNQTANNQTVSAKVTCICRRYQPCSCDDNDDADYVRSLVGDGRFTSFDQDQWVATPQNSTVDGQKTNTTLVISGTLANGTGGINADTSAAGFGMQSAAEKATWGAVAAAVGVAVMVM